jgi:hypothetical protein
MIERKSRGQPGDQIYSAAKKRFYDEGNSSQQQSFASAMLRFLLKEQQYGEAHTLLRPLIANATAPLNTSVQQRMLIELWTTAHRLMEVRCSLLFCHAELRRRKHLKKPWSAFSFPSAFHHQGCAL